MSIPLGPEHATPMPPPTPRRAGEAVRETVGGAQDLPSARAQFEASRSEEAKAAMNKDRKSQVGGWVAGGRGLQCRGEAVMQMATRKFAHEGASCPGAAFLVRSGTRSPELQASVQLSWGSTVHVSADRLPLRLPLSPSRCSGWRRPSAGTCPCMCRRHTQHAPAAHCACRAARPAPSACSSPMRRWGTTQGSRGRGTNTRSRRAT